MAEVVQLGSPVTEEEVWTACDALVSSGEEVTRRAVLRAVGRGSMTTVARMVTTWEERQRVKVEARDFDLSPEESEQILMMGRQLLRSLTDRVRIEAAAREKELMEAAERERRRATSLAADYDILTAERTADQETHNTDIARLNAELAQTQSDFADATTALSDMAVRLQQVTGRADAAETRAAAAEGRIAEAVAAAGEAKGRADALAADLAETKRRADALASDLSATKTAAEKMATALAESERETARQVAAAALAEERARSAAELADERARGISTLEARVTDADRRAALAEAALAKAEADLATLRSQT